MTIKQFKEYHWQWLIAHPSKSPEWLARMVSEGFDIHHRDGNKENNWHENLVLIESQDHFFLHGANRLNRLTLCRDRKWRTKEQAKALTDKGKLAYDERISTGLIWKEIGKRIGINNVIMRAKEYAKYNNKDWPIDVSHLSDRIAVNKVAGILPNKNEMSSHETPV